MLENYEVLLKEKAHKMSTEGQTHNWFNDLQRAKVHGEHLIVQLPTCSSEQTQIPCVT